MKVLQGTCRKISLPVLGVAVVGWVVFLIGFVSFNRGDNFYNDIRNDRTYKVDEDLGFPNNTMAYFIRDTETTDKMVENDFPPHRADLDYFPYWLYIVSFPVMMVVVVLHLILHNLVIFGVIGHFLLWLTVVSGAGAFWGTGRRLYSEDDNLREMFAKLFPEDWRTDSYYGMWLVVEWVGVLICMLALCVYIMFLPFYTASCKKARRSDVDEENMEMEEK